MSGGIAKLLLLSSDESCHRRYVTYQLLDLIGAIEILPRMYGRVTIPDVVLRELTDQEAPKEVSTWAKRSDPNG